MKRSRLKVGMYIGLTVLLLVICGAIFVATRPNEFHVSRSVEMEAPPEVIFPHVNRLSAWEAWSPYEQIDPEMEKTFEGPEQGEGAVMRWKGNSQAGAGSTKIIQSVPNKSVQIQLTMTEPFGCENDVLFTFVPNGESTTVTWAMTGNVGFGGKLIHLFINMDRMVGGQFQDGLTQLKEIAEKQATADTT